MLAMAKKNVEKAATKRSGGVVINQAEIDSLRRSATFSSRLMISPRTERPFFYFRHHGDALEGFLGTSHNNTNIRRGISRIIETPDGTEEFFCNQKLAKAIKDFALEGKYIRIIYIGQEFTGYGHARKCYQLEELPVTSRARQTVKTGKPEKRQAK